MYNINKTIIFLVCLCFVIGLTTLNAQNQIVSTVKAPSATNLQVNPLVGNLYYKKDVFSLPSKGFDLGFSLHYNSTNSKDVGFGKGWSHSFSFGYERKLITIPTSVDNSCIQGGNNGAIVFPFQIPELVFSRSDGSEIIYTGIKFCPLSSRADTLNYTRSLGHFDSLTIANDVITLKNKIGTTYFYENKVHRQVTKIIDRNNNSLTFTYDSNGKLTKVTDVAGRFLTFTWTGERISSVVDANETPNRVIKFQYDTDKSLSKIIDPLSNETTFSYFEKSYLSGVTDENGNSSAVSYRRSGENVVVSQVSTCLTKQTFSYSFGIDGNGTTFSKETTEAGEQITTFTFVNGKNTQREGNCCGFKTQWAYDGENNITTITDGNNNATQFQYDTRGNRLKETDPAGCSMTYTFEPVFNQVTSVKDKNGNTTTYTYDNRGNLTRIDRPLSISEIFAYDAAGNVTSSTDGNGNITTYVYNNNGYLTQINHPVNNFKTLYTYDNRGNRLTMTDANGNVTRYEYDLLNRLLKTTDALNQVTSFTYDAKGNRLTATNAKGQVVKFKYDALDRLTDMTLPESNAYKFLYDTRSNLIRTQDPRGGITNYTYNSKNLVERINDPLGYSTFYDYDAVGNRTSIIDANGNQMRYTYDNRNRLKERTDALGFVTKYAFDCSSNLLSTTDANNNVVSIAYDVLNRVTQQTDAMRFVSKFEYDKNNNLTKITDAKNNVTTYTFDGLNRNTVVTYADNSKKTYTFDGIGNVKTRLDGNNNTTRYTYDALNRLTLRDYPDANDDVFQYDPLGNMTLAKNANAEIRFVYDSLNRLLSETLNNRATQYAYDTHNGKRTLIYPSGKVVDELYDVKGQLTTIKEDGTFLAAFTYDSVGRMKSRRYANNTATAYEYDKNNRLTRLTHNPNAFIDLLYTYDNVGNILAQTYAHKSDRSEQYGYDANYRLTNYKKGPLSNGSIATPTKQITYNYDALGNRTTVIEDAVISNYTTNNMNAYTSLTVAGGATTSFSYDGNGNMTALGSQILNYDFDNHLSMSNTNNNVVSYGYDALKRKVSRTANNVNSAYFYNGYAEIENVKNQDELETVSVYTDILDDIISTQKNIEKYFFSKGEFNSVLSNTNSSGQIVNRAEYDPFGKQMTFDANYINSSSNTINQLSFTGRILDNITNLSDSRNRHYNQILGRFIQRDLIEFGDGFNFYSYVENNPINYFDPVGTQKVKSPYALVAHCIGLANEMTKVKNELKKRHSDLCENKNDLPEFGENSIDGHKQQYEGKQNRLKNLLAEWQKLGCFSVATLPNGVTEWANQPTPSEGHSLNRPQKASPSPSCCNLNQKAAIGAFLGAAAAEWGWVLLPLL